MVVSRQQELDPGIMTTFSLLVVRPVFRVLDVDDDLFLLRLQLGLCPLHGVKVGGRRVRPAQVTRL